MRFLMTLLAVLATLSTSAMAIPPNLTFNSIDGGELALDDWADRPVLVVNTASLCAFTEQYDGLQALYDRYRDSGLIVLAVPSDDFRQELSSNGEVREFCGMVFGLDIPMTTITSVTGPDAHPLFQWFRAEAGFQPRWNFNKVLIGADGEVVATYGSIIDPLSARMIRDIEAVLN